MSYQYAPLSERDRAAVVSIFNYFVERSFAAFPEEPAGPMFFDHVLAMASGYPALAIRTDAGETVGFGVLRAYHPAATLRRTAEIAYFILPEHTGRGIGTGLLQRLTAGAQEIGVDNIIASVSSLNEQSLRFHEKAGFERAGTLRAVGRKHGRDFDIVLFQKVLYARG
ncbi:MAG: N-acetyltransferase family protein [bacterium]|jgi:L-amino acid N-acyltransferase YncA